MFDGYFSDAVFNNAHPDDVRTLETWATTVEILFAINRYRDMFNLLNYEYLEKNFQEREILDNNFYTSAGWDMIDNINQRFDINPPSILKPIDRVNGYTVKQLEDGLRGATSWNGWRNNIKARSNNPTENFVNELFNNWN